VVWGGVSLWRSLMRLDLIDELQLSLFPYVAGEGTRLFDGVPKSYQLDLLSSTASSNGISSCSTVGTAANPAAQPVGTVTAPNHPRWPANESLTRLDCAMREGTTPVLVPWRRRSSNGRLALAAADGHDHAGVFFDPGPV
jgi:RibD C-terminal domain